MEQFNLLKKISKCFDTLNIPYFITGSIASMTYGEPRFTNDIDMVADIKEEHIPGLKKCFPEAEYYLNEESIVDALSRKSQFNIIHPESGLKIDIIIKKENDFDRKRFSRIKPITMEDTEIKFASPEDVILKKMEYYRMGGSEKHLRDITGMIKISRELINLNYIEKWISYFDVAEIWEAIKNRLGI